MDLQVLAVIVNDLEPLHSLTTVLMAGVCLAMGLWRWSREMPCKTFFALSALILLDYSVVIVGAIVAVVWWGVKHLLTHDSETIT